MSYFSPSLFVLQPMGSERMEMRKRQMSTTQETPGAAQAQHSTGNRGSNACCFCWCCCCSCSWYYTLLFKPLGNGVAGEGGNRQRVGQHKLNKTPGKFCRAGTVREMTVR